MATEQVSTTVPHIEELERIYRDHPSFIIRPLSASDLEAYHSLWKQPMLHLNQDDTDLHTDLSQTQDRLIRITKTLPSHGMHYAIFWKNSDGREGELMGEGGMKILEYSWPSLYYTFRNDADSRRWICAFVRLLSGHWNSFPRKEKEIPVYSFSIPLDFLKTPRPVELLCTETRSDDQDSERYLVSLGYEHCGTLPNGRKYWRCLPEVTVSTVLPKVENLSTRRVSSERLILRPLRTSDIEAYHSVRKQPEPMYGLSRTGPDVDLNETRTYFENRKSMVGFGIFLNNSDGREGELIGEVGVNIFSRGFPALFYILKKEYWGYGYGTELVEAFIGFWRSLPREDEQVRVPLYMVDLRETSKGTELLIADAFSDNERSKKVLRKVGFEKCAKYSGVSKREVFRYPLPKEVLRS